MISSAVKEESAYNPRNSTQPLKADLSDAAGAAKDDIRAKANDAGRKARGFLNSAGEEFSHAAKKVTDHVHEKPVQSSLIALGLGMVLGAWLRR